MLCKTSFSKYDGPGNPTMIVQIGKMIIPNTLLDMGTAIKIITKETIEILGLTNLRPTPTISELVGRSKI